MCTPPTSPRSSVAHSYAGLYGNVPGQNGNLVDCYVDVKVDGLQCQITTRILFQNNTKNDFEDAIFHTGVAGEYINDFCRMFH